MQQEKPILFSTAAHLRATTRETIKQQLGVTSAAGPTQSRLFYVTDRASGLKLLINTGVEVSVVPRLHTHWKTQTGPSLQAINNTSIPTYGTCSLILNLGLRRTYR